MDNLQIIFNIVFLGMIVASFFYGIFVMRMLYKLIKINQENIKTIGELADQNTEGVQITHDSIMSIFKMLSVKKSIMGLNDQKSTTGS